MSKRVGGVLVVVALAACSQGDGLGPRVQLPGVAAASVELPDGWEQETRGITVVARSPSSDGTRIDVNAAPRKEYGTDRTPEVLLKTVVALTASTPNAQVTKQELAKLGSAPAALVEWTYELEGKQVVRRHWAVSLPSAVVHVSCIGYEGSVPSACDSVAASARGQGQGGN